MAAIDDLRVNIATLSAKVDTLLAKPSGVPDADVAQAAADVAAISAKIPD